LRSRNRRGLVLAHEPAVAGDIGGKNGGEPTLSREFSVHHLLSGATANGGIKLAVLWHITLWTARS